MTPIRIHLFRLTLALVMLAATGSIGAPGAQARTRVMPTVRGGIGPTVQHGAQPNAIYGTIVQMTGNVLTIRTRAGRLRQVDATPAIRAGTYSAPLFIGKLVVAEGVVRANGMLTAARVSRLSRLEGSDADR